jgi:dihydropteroate synthase
VSVGDELERVLPVVRELVGSGVCVSVDTTKSEVARAVLDAGASVINDVSGRADPALLRHVAASGASIVLMHNRGRGEVAPPNTDYDDVVEEVLGELAAAVDRALDAGIGRERIWIDPGLGFAKTPAQSLRLLGALDRLVDTGLPVLVGPSRKAFLGAVAPDRAGVVPGPGDREGGTAGAVALAAFLGARAVRVHEARSTRQAFLVGRAARYASEESL